MVQINCRPEAAHHALILFCPFSANVPLSATQGVALGYYVRCAFSAHKTNARKAEERSYDKSPRIKISQLPSNPVTEIS
jgi:hypothetical protein